MYNYVFNTGWARIVVAIQVVLAILICASVNGQDTLMSEEVKVLKDFDAQLSRISRIRNYPKPLERDSAIIREDIQPQSLSFEIPIYLDQVKYPYMDAPEGPAIYTSYVSLGGGFPRRFQLAAEHSIQNDGVFELMIKGRLDQAESKKVQYQGYKEQDIELAGRYFFDPEWDICFHSGVQRDVR